MTEVYYKGKLMTECWPHERVPIKVGILINNEVRFFKFAPERPVISFGEMSNTDNYTWLDEYIPNRLDDGEEPCLFPCDEE